MKNTMMNQSIKSYSELCRLNTFEERFDYLKLNGKVGEETFGFDRYLNQIFYHDDEWLSTRDKVILRDQARDLGMPDRELHRVIVHHIKPITKEDILNRDQKLFDLENLICCSPKTHKAIHYGNKDMLECLPAERSKNDTSPWKK